MTAAYKHFIITSFKDMIQILVILHYNSFTALFSPQRPTGYVDSPNFYWQRNTVLSCLELPHRPSYEVPMWRILATFFLKLHKH